MKKLLVLCLTGILVTGLAGCGSAREELEKKAESLVGEIGEKAESLVGELEKQVEKADSQSADSSNSQTSGSQVSSVDFGSLTVDNYEKLVKEAFGLDVKVPDGGSVTEADSPNGVNNMIVKFTLPAGADGMQQIEEYFNQCIALGGVWGQEINWDTFAISKGTQYTDFAALSGSELTAIDDFSSVMWLYDFGSKHVQFSYSQDGTYAELSLTYATLNLDLDLSDFVPQEGQGPEGWVWQEDHGWIDRVWDSDTLPENFPKEIPGVWVEDTWYYGYGCEDRYMGARVGNMYFEDWDFEQWQLTFDATDDQLAQFEQALLDNGFLGEKTEDEYQGTYAEVTDGEIYLYYFLDESDRDGYDWNVYCNMTIPGYEYPLFFEAIELPMLGLFMAEDPNDCLIYAYDEEFNEVEYEYDFADGRGYGDAAYVMYHFNYMGVSREMYDEYIDYLRTLKTEEWDEYVYSEEDDSYVVSFKYLNHYIGCYHNFDGEINGMTFIISPDRESLFW